MSTEFVVITVLSFTLFVLFGFSWYLKIELRRIQNIINEQSHGVERAQADVRALLTGAAGLGDHLGKVDQQMKRLDERLNELDLRDPISQSYEHAIKLAKKGAGIDELIETCGLVHDEAELLLRMYLKDKTS
ncbi:MAG: DUF2802 domain-containing protein [Gammaproteobacteria bacterium]|nr:DUF2802 domain-containing protein [Gammaproteobacteria bacterium]